MSFAPPLPARPPCPRSNRLRFRTIARYGLNARKYTKKISEIAIIQADIRFLGRLCVKTYRNRPFRGPVGGFFRFALRTTKGATDTAIRGTATTCRRTESRGPIRPKFRFHAPPRPEHEPAAILESATRCLTLSPAAPPRSYRHKAALSPTLANELLGILHPYRIFVLLYESYHISECHRIIPTASVIRRPLPAATGRVYNSDLPLNCVRQARAIALVRIAEPPQQKRNFVPQSPPRRGLWSLRSERRHLGSTSNIQLSHKCRHLLRRDENIESHPAFRLRQPRRVAPSSLSLFTASRLHPSAPPPYIIWRPQIGRHPRIKIPRDNRHRSGASAPSCVEKNARDATRVAPPRDTSIRKVRPRSGPRESATSWPSSHPGSDRSMPSRGTEYG